MFPILWHEPFGLTIVEALASATPVVALGAGAAPELVIPGVTGVICSHSEQLPFGIYRAVQLDPTRCRADAVARFDATHMAAAYERVYRRAVGAETPTG